MPKKVRKHLLNIFLGLLLILLIGVLLIQTKESSKPTVTNELPIELEPVNIPEENTTLEEEETKPKIELQSSPDVDLKYYQEKYKNTDIVARLEIPNLFNIFITKCNDNEYYLNHSIQKKKDVKGTEFMDFRVTPESKQVNIYGHNSRTYNTPFRKLESFKDKTFFEENKYIILQTENGRRIYEIFSIKEVSTDNEHMIVNYSGADFLKHIENLKKNSLYEREVEYNEDSNLLVLQTCSYDSEKSYYVISAIQIEV